MSPRSRMQTAHVKGANHLHECVLVLEKRYKHTNGKVTIMSHDL